MTRTHAPVSLPVALTIAGSDSGGGAGIQADLKTMEAHDVFGTSAITATTAQNTSGVEDINVLPTDHIAAQYDAVVDDFAVGAIKTGMLATAEVIETVTDCLADFAGPVVVDPVMVAATGDRLLSEEAEAVYEDLFDHATLVTPNADEAELLTDRTVDSVDAAEAAGRDIVELGADAALVKGGHIDGDSGTAGDSDEVVDTLVIDESATDATHTEQFTHPRIDTDATHGSGCTLSSAIAARMAREETLTEAVAGGVAFMERAVRYGIDAGSGPGSVHHLVEMRERADREATTAAVERIVARLVEANVETLVPPSGMDVVGATPYAETPAEVVGVDGRLSRTRTGIRHNAGVRSGTASDLAHQLLAAREAFPALRFACTIRFDDAVEHVLETLDGPVVRGDPGTPTDAAAAAVADADQPPAAIIDPGDEGRQPAVILVAADAATLHERTLSVADALLTE
ncbi:bifunctional hydroxymethylpyrimidine kinase/phosphomethylpyrimidine kinase [Halonotius terrestris]|uniref:Bifunctional hydroxymethylpyrimidine kinase/phosphomethylpyrimidine kinase n=1 Tax=Halonotius terrestris TaxID=2487750 RepID=A0A8J8PC59_9EURY|nr:bifunctional hydroxymethylpyrimidine kinase/phosphomethylpyrimidine kinase [Halonotius terrestris]TQQ83674.1 bifunctional hydroxymethylpyrimidine kinase/phosphomethylpyrimidine kinase [Halonotius terrestris]